jgi:hypothetical protein
MILVDTSVWIDHINASDPILFSLLAEERVLAHPSLGPFAFLGKHLQSVPNRDGIGG